MREEQSFKLTKLVEQLSHELRTPLNAILGYSELLEKSENLNSTDKKHLENITSSGAKLLDVINDIIEISNIESGNVKNEPKVFEVSELKEGVCNKFETAARLKGLSFAVDIQNSEKLGYQVDVKKVKTVLNSLVSNALKFTDEGGIHVLLSISDVKTEAGNNQLNISVKDTGRGISQEDLQHVFKPFWQVISEDKGGTGLGLTTSRKLINLLGGNISIISESGTGSTVEVSIPIKTADNKTFSKVDVEHSAINQQNVRGLRALIVDDLPVNRTLARIMLEMKEFETLEAQNGKEAFDYYCVEKPDVVLMDISMPVMDGIEAMEKIRNFGKQHGKDVPIIAVTAGGHTGSRNELIQKGFSEYIQKPYREKELFDKIGLFLPVSDKNRKSPSLKSATSFTA